MPYAENPDIDGRVWEALHVAHALRRSGEFDLVHNNLDWLPLSFAELCAAPMVTTIHGFSNRAILPAYRRSARASAFVSISDSDRVPELDYAATVYHGIDLAALPFSPAGGEDLVILGRIHPDKGTAEAIEIARLAGRRLLICGIVQDARVFRRTGASRTSTTTLSSTWDPSGRSNVRRCSVRRSPCCTRSPSTSRSGCPWWSRWPAAHR